MFNFVVKSGIVINNIAVHLIIYFMPGVLRIGRSTVVLINSLTNTGDCWHKWVILCLRGKYISIIYL